MLRCQRGKSSGNGDNDGGMTLIDYRAQLYDPIYATLGVPAVLTTVGNSSVDSVTANLTLIDRTSAEALQLGGLGRVSVETTKPVYRVRAYELADNDIDPDMLDRATVVVNGATWTVNSHGPRPAPTGAADGEVALFLLKVV